MNSSTLCPSIVLAAYAEPLLTGRKVVVFGRSNSNLVERLQERGARQVLVLDRDGRRRAEAESRSTSRQVRFAPMASESAADDSQFDLAIVENLADIGDVTIALRLLGRLLTKRGAALVCCPNPDVEVSLLQVPDAPKISIDYYSLYDAVAEQFEHVRMLGQTPFVGYAVADFAPGSDPAPAMDTGFLPAGAEEPELFIALCSQHSMLLDEFAIVQLPFSATWGKQGPGREEERLRAARAQERRALQRISALEAENRRLSRAEAQRVDDKRVEALQAELEQSRAALASLEHERSEAHAELGKLQEELAGARSDLIDNTRELEELQEAYQREQEHAQSAERALEAERRLAGTTHDQLRKDHEAELERLRAKLLSLEGELERKVEPPEQEAQDPLFEREIVDLEERLAQSASELRRLQQDNTKLERLAKNAVLELAEGVAQVSNRTAAADLAELRKQLQALALANARGEANLTAARWQISALKRKLAEATQEFDAVMEA